MNFSSKKHHEPTRISDILPFCFAEMSQKANRNYTLPSRSPSHSKNHFPDRWPMFGNFSTSITAKNQ